MKRYFGKWRTAVAATRWRLFMTLAVGVAIAFVGGRALTSLQVEADAPPPTGNATFLSATPMPGEAPDFREDFWYQKWLNQDNNRTRADIVVNGISVGPTVNQSGTPCNADSRPAPLSFEEAQSSPLGVHFGYLPAGAVVEPQAAVACGGQVAAVEVWVTLPQADDSTIREALQNGASFFDVAHGGRIEVVRLVSDPATASSIPVERWSSADIAGHPAAIGRPIVDAGFGPSEVMVYADGVLTVIRGLNLSLDEMIRIAEGLFE